MDTIHDFTEPTCATATVDDPKATPPEPFEQPDDTSTGKDRATSTAFGYLADAVIRDQDVSAMQLVLIAYAVTHVNWRTVVADLAGKYPIVKPGTGAGRNNIEAALKSGKTLGLVDRVQLRPFEKATEVHHLPPTDRGAVKIERRMFVGVLSLKATAAIIFIRSGTGKGPHIYARELQERFGWAPGTALKVLRELQQHGLIFRHPHRNERGQLDGVSYSLQPTEKSRISSTHQKPGRQRPGHTKSGHGHKTPLHTLPPATDLNFKYPHVIGEPSAIAPGVSDRERKNELDWKGLSNWSTSRAVENYMALPTSDWFNPNVEYQSIMTPTEWRAALERFTDDEVPSHLLSSNALKQATEIALTLRDGDENDAIIDFEAMLGIAWYIGQALNGGRPIRSLAFIAVRLAHFVQQGDFSWARDFPMDLSEKESEVAQTWVEFGIAAFDRLDTAHDPDKLRASRRAQDVIYLVNTYGRDAVQRVLTTPIKGFVTNWRQLEGFIKAEVTEAGTREKT